MESVKRGIKVKKANEVRAWGDWGSWLGRVEVEWGEG